MYLDLKQIKHKFRRTFLLLELQRAVVVISFLGLGFLAFYPGQENSEVYSIFMVAMVPAFFLLSYNKWALLTGHDIGLRKSRFIAVFSFFGPLFPLALASWFECQESENQKFYFNYFHDQKQDENYFPIETLIQKPSKMAYFNFGLALAAITAVVQFTIQNPKLKVVIREMAFPSYKLPSQLTISDLYRLGSNCNTKSDYVCSVSVFSRIYEMDPEDGMALANLAMAQSAAGLHNSALKNFESYFDHNSSAIDVKATYAHTLRALGYKDKALEHNLEILRDNPEFIDVMESALQLLLEKKQDQAAYDLIENFEKRVPRASDTFSILKTRIKTRLLLKAETNQFKQEELIVE